ncbi:MAG: glycosyltransferase [Bacteroidales bacterium]|nr:glycosyltransferase [Bacteroidales bacterium]
MRNTSDNHIHIVSFDIPCPVNYGGVIDVFFKLKALVERGFKVHFHCFEYGRDHSERLEALCVETKYYKRDMSFWKAFSKIPYIVTSRISEDLIQDLLKDDYPIILEGLHSCGVLLDKRMKGRKIFVRSHNVEHEYYQYLAETEKNLRKRLFLKMESRKLRRFESIMAEATGILAISNKDYEYFKERFDNVYLIPAYAGFDKVDVLEGQGDFVLYHGKLDVSENYNAAEYLVKEVFKGSGIKLKIAGMNPPRYLVKLIENERNIELIENPEDDVLQDLIRNAQINILVTAQATGLKLKLLNALFNGRYCVVNDKMVEGLDINDLCIVANTADEMKTVVSDLMTKPFVEEQVEIRKSRMDAFYNPSRATDKLVELLG